MAKPESRRTVLVGGVAVAAALAGGGAAWWRFRTPEGETGLDPAFWTRSFPTPEGGQFSLAGLRGRPVLVNFWATWCAPCVEEMPRLDRFYRDNAARGLHVVGLAVDRAPAVRQFLGHTPVSFPIALAGMAGVDLSRTLGNQAGGLPFSVLIGRDGRVRERRIGQLSVDELSRWMQVAFP